MNMSLPFGLSGKCRECGSPIGHDAYWTEPDGRALSLPLCPLCYGKMEGVLIDAREEVGDVREKDMVFRTGAKENHRLSIDDPVRSGEIPATKLEIKDVEESD